MIVKNDTPVLEDPKQTVEGNAMVPGNNIQVKDPQDPKDPKPAVNKEKVYSYLVSLYDNAGKRYNKNKLKSISSSSDLRYWIDFTHKKTGQKKLDDNGYKKLSLSWTDVKEVEKKNQNHTLQQSIPQNAVATTPTGTGSPSILESSPTTLVPQDPNNITQVPQPKVDEYYIERLDERTSILPILKQLPRDFLKMEEADAEVKFNEVLGDFGYSASESNVGNNALNITRPDGTQFEIKLMSEQGIGVGQLGALINKTFKGEEKVNQRVNVKHNKFVMDLALGKSNLVGVISNYIDESPFGVNDAMKRYSFQMNQPKEDDLNFLSKALTGQENSNIFKTPEGFNSNLFINSIKQLKRNLTPAYNDIVKKEKDYKDSVISSTLASTKTGNLRLPENPGDSLTEEELKSNIKIKSTLSRIDDILKKYEQSKRNTSKILGKSLKRSDKLAQIDLSNEEQITGLISSGLDMLDMPLPSLLINDKQASFQDVYDLISRPKELGYIQRGEIRVSIDDSVDVGVFNDLVKKLKVTQKRNTAFLDEGNPRLNSFFRGVADIPQGIYAHTLDILSNFGVALQDSLEMFGVSPEVAEYVVFNQTGVYLPGAKGSPGMSTPRASMPTKKEVEEAMKLLPEYNGSISDSRGVGEFLSYGMQGFTSSVPYIAAFMTNPGLGLGVTFGSTYGGSIEEVREARKSAREAESAGIVLTEKQKDLLEMSSAKARGYAFFKAGGETLITAAFTAKYFKQLRLANGMKNVSKTQESSQQLASAFADQNRKGLIAAFSKYTGLEYKTLLSEVPEEQFIAYTGYLTDVVFGLKEYDNKTAMKLAVDAGLNSLFSSAGMSMASKAISKNVNNIADEVINRKITLDGEISAVQNKLKSDMIVSQLEDSGELPSSPKFKVALDMQRQADDAILLFEKRKQDLVGQMTPSHKATFLQGIADLEALQGQINDSETEPEVVNSAQDQIETMKFKMRRILAAYPSELSYYFLPKDQQSALTEKALEQLSKEKEGETFSLTSEDSEVTQRAAEIYKKEVLENMRDSSERIDVAGYFNDHISYDDLEIDVDEDYDPTDFNLAQEIILLNKPDAVETLLGEDAIDKETEKQENKSDEQIFQEKQDEKRQEESIYRIKQLNLSQSFYEGLDTNGKAIIKKFFTDIKNGFRPKFARVETLLDAQETINDLKVLNTKKIDILENPKLLSKKNINPFSLVQDIFPYVNNFGRKMMMGRTKVMPKNLMTSDIFLGAIFRDTSKGKPFIDLVSAANRNVASAMNTSAEFVNQDVSLFENEIKAYNKANPKNKISTDLRNLELSYEMQVLAHLRRKSGEIDESTGLDTEFQRQKNSLFKELELRKQEYEDDPDNITEAKYKYLKDTLERLGLDSALSYEDVSRNGKQPILNALNRLSERFPHQEAKQRKKDYEGKDTFFVEGTYVPSFRKADNGQESSDANRTRNKKGSDFGTFAGILQDVTEDDTLENSRLSFGNYFERAYQQMQGSFIDMNSRKDFETIDMIVNSDGFKDLFSKEGKDYQSVQKYFGSRMEIFNYMISQGQNVQMDFGSPDLTATLGKVGQAFYSTLSATGLSRFNQPASQFYSATTGTMPMLNDSRARNHLQLANARFLYSMAGVGSGQKTAKYAQWANNLIKGGQLSNIYSQSRTGLRNALKAEFAIGENTKLPFDYYVSKFNMDSSLFSDEIRGLQYTVDGILDVITKSSELSLEFFLANADRAAANSAFEAHYLQNRIDQGAIIPKDISAWWKRENENPDTEAIEYADRRIAETMRQTEPTSEAEFYAINAKTGTKVAQRMVFPWGKFMLNAKANFANQYARSKDKNVPELQRQEARKRMRGILNEVAVFNGIKLGTGRVATIGLVGAAMMQFGVDEDDIDRYGGMTKLIGDALLPIEDREYEEQLSKIPRGQRETLEGFKASFDETATGLDYTLLELYKTTMEYENKYTVSENYSVLLQMATDMFKTTLPFAAPDPLYDLGFAVMNEMLGEEVIPEYISSDLDKMGTSTDEKILLLKENLGMYSVGFEQYDKFTKAYTLYKDRVFKKPGSGVSSTGIIEYLAADTPAMQAKLDNIVDYLLYARTANLLLPVPKGDVNNLLNKLERQIEENFTRSSPSIKGVNNAFFKAYLDYRTKEQNLPVDMNNIGEWWEKEQKNMDRSAKKHALDVVENIRKNAATPKD
tara:strand:- start:1141 stop:7674 length:6534 start_codon:yes stop_codon:yes gene_type:complete